MAGIPAADYQTDGIDLSPLWKSERALQNRNLFWRMGNRRAIRSGQWKLCVTNNRSELFNLGVDVGEQQNLAAAHPEIVNKLNQAIKGWEADVDTSAQKLKNGN